MVQFGEYAPDQAQINTKFSKKTLNVIANEGFFEPIKSPTVITDALPNKPQGAAYFYTNDGARVSIVGDKNALYKLGSGTWSNISSAPYGASIDNLWSYAQFGNLAIATNGHNNVQKFDVNAGANFEDLGGDPPKAKYVIVVRDFVVLLNTENSQTEVAWCSINDPESWEILTNSSDRQILTDGGIITGGAGGEEGYIFQDREIQRMIFTSGREIFRFEKIGNGLGCLSSKSIVQHINKIFFLGTDGFYMLAGGEFVPIGAQRVSETFFKNCRPDYVNRVQAVVDEKKQIVMWFYADVTTAANGLSANRVLIYNWVSNRWSHANIDSAGVISTLSITVSLDDSDYSEISPDDLNLSFDDASFFGNDPSISIFKDDNKLYYLNGLPMEAIIETGDIQPNLGGRAFVSGISPVTDADDIRCSVATKERASNPEIFEPENDVEDTGEIPIHGEARLFNVRIRIPANEPWSELQGIDINFSNAGDI